MSGSLRSMSDHEILSRTLALSGQERRLTLELLQHLNEVERRRLFLKSGYSSMFVYCTSRLRLSEPAAARRIRTARCLARFPELSALLESGEVNLSTVCMVAKHLTPGNAADILARIRGRSRREVERIVAELEPRAVLPPDRVRTVIVPVAVTTPAAPASAAVTAGWATPPVPAAAAPQVTVAGDSASTRSVEGEAGGNDRASLPPDARFEPHALIQFSASEAFMELVERVRSIASHRLPPNATLEQVFALVMNEYVKREDPQARHERRATKRDVVQKAPVAARSPRRIPAGVRDRVHARDSGRCTYMGPGGRRCGSSRHVQIDHIRPVARGGGATPDNLRLLCAHHNRLEAERLMGRSRAPDG